jgi:hypothetical protein
MEYKNKVSGIYTGAADNRGCPVVHKLRVGGTPTLPIEQTGGSGRRGIIPEVVDTGYATGNIRHGGIEGYVSHAWKDAIIRRIIKGNGGGSVAMHGKEKKDKKKTIHPVHTIE